MISCGFDCLEDIEAEDCRLKEERYASEAEAWAAELAATPRSP